MSFEIPITTNGSSFFSLQATLDAVTYTLEFRWNVRLEAWFMSIFDAQGTTPYLVGIRLVVDWPLGAYNTGRTPPGLFFALDTGAPVGGGIDPGFDDLGDRVRLAYVPLDELA